jgi:multidrug efflux system membrane fusion protein
MLVQVTFLAPPGASENAAQTAAPRFLLPRALVESSDGGSHVWIADQAASVARYRPVKLGPAVGDLITILEGLTASDKAIVSGRDALHDGQRIRVTGEDVGFGVSNRGAASGSERITRTPPTGKK